jgi:Tripartite tricarboxylate transporter family receptor
LVGTVSSNAINAALYTRLDLDRDFQPVSLLVRFPNLLIVNAKLPVRSVTDLIAYLKANPGKVNYGSSGLGMSSHLSVVMFALATGAEMTHIPFRSTGEVVNNLIGGNIDLGIDSVTTYGSGEIKINLPKFKLANRKEVTWTLGAEFGHQSFGTASQGSALPSYAHWRLGAAFKYDVLSFDLSYHDKNLSKEDCFILAGDSATPLTMPSVLLLMPPILWFNSRSMM